MEKQGCQPRFYLIRAATGEWIALTHSPYLIGREIGAVSYCMAEDPQISRRHAALLIQNGQCSISDQGSTNHTRLNSRTLPPFVPFTLTDGDRIGIGSELFVFRQVGFTDRTGGSKMEPGAIV